MGDMEEANGLLQHADSMRSQVNAVPEQLSNFYRSRLEGDLYRLKESMTRGSGLELFEYRKRAAKSCKMLLKVSKKAAEHRTEAYRLRGVHYWLINKQKKALESWRKAIEEGERLGARLELSRAFFEVGRRLLEDQSQYRTLEGIKAEEYLEKARVLFEEMGLQWDLDELSRVGRV
jgi:hypothetical protein